MKKHIAVLAAAVLLAVFAGHPALADTSKSITVYNWGQYISDGTDGYIDVIDAFEQETGITVNYVTFDSNETMYTKLKTGGESIDVIIPSDYMIARLIEEEMLLELNFDNIPNFAYVDDEFKYMDYDPENRYSVPYTWGTVGVIYNKKYVDPEDIGSWDLLWNEKYAGRILMFDNCRDAFGIAELCLGYSLNTTSQDELRAAGYLLTQQKPYIQAYVMDQIFSSMEREEAWIAPYYAGDYLMMVQENPDLGFYFPEEGFNIFVDAMCIPKSAQNKEGAEAFINFLCRPEISGENLDYLGYSTPISAAKEYMDPETAASPIAYPDEETLARSASFTFLPTQSSQLMDALWLEVQTSGTSAGTYYIATAVLAVLAAALILGLKTRKRLRRARRGRYYQPGTNADS